MMYSQQGLKLFYNRGLNLLVQRPLAAMSVQNFRTFTLIQDQQVPSITIRELNMNIERVFKEGKEVR